jgi:RimJ/RimL family protein N-acetyltransferase
MRIGYYTQEGRKMAILQTTERLLLRKLNENYLGSIINMMCDPRVNEYFYGFQRVKDSAQLNSYTLDYFFSPFAATYAEFGIGGIAIHERGTTDCGIEPFVGITGFFPPPNHNPEFGPELLYVLGSKYHGKGYAFEAAKATIELARAVPELKSLSLTTDAPNKASRGIAEKLGFCEFGQVAAYGAEDMVFYTKKLR